MKEAKKKPAYRYEDNAEWRTGIEGWVCRACLRYWGNHRDMASYCCATDRPCECGARMPKSRIRCDACHQQEQDAKWHAMPRIDWDGETPLCEYDGDRFFFDADEVVAYLDDHPDLSLADFRLVLCEQEELPVFEMGEFLCDHTSEDGHDTVGCAEIDKVINDWIRANVTPLWYPTGKAVTLESLRLHTGIEDSGPDHVVEGGG